MLCSLHRLKLSLGNDRNLKRRDEATGSNSRLYGGRDCPWSRRYRDSSRGAVLPSHGKLSRNVEPSSVVERVRRSDLRRSLGGSGDARCARYLAGVALLLL
jgi:hypothetical protein